MTKRKKIRLPDPTTEQIAELARWLVDEGSKGKKISWPSVVAYARAILAIARAELGTPSYRKLTRGPDHFLNIAMGHYRNKAYWVGDPVIEKLSGKDPDAIHKWLKRVGMEP
jgi:hypothetical protein